MYLHTHTTNSPMVRICSQWKQMCMAQTHNERKLCQWAHTLYIYTLAQHINESLN